MTTAPARPFHLSRTNTASALSMPGMVGVYFGLRACITFVFFRADPQAGTQVSIALNLLLLVVVVFYSAGPAVLTLRQAMQTRPFKLVLFFLGLSLCSLLWTEAQSTLVAASYWAALAADVLLVFFVFRVEPAEVASNSIIKGFVWGVFLLALVGWIAPTMPDLRIGDDDFLSPNVIGFECAMGALFCQYLAPQGARWKWLGAALAITLLRSLSKTSILAFAVMEAFYLTRNKSISRGAKVALTAAALLVLSAFSGLLMAYYSVYTHAGTQVETLTGRTPIWIAAFTFAVQEPWLGHGFHSFHTVVPVFGSYQAWHAHNELLHQFFNYGIVGVVLVLALYISLVRQARQALSHPLRLATQSLLLLVFVRSFTDTERFDLSLPLWLITTLSLALAHPAEFHA